MVPCSTSSCGHWNSGGENSGPSKPAAPLNASTWWSSVAVPIAVMYAGMRRVKAGGRTAIRKATSAITAAAGFTSCQAVTLAPIGRPRMFGSIAPIIRMAVPFM